jgi:methylated-DNA-[protein]-cysteine S-methyltransferase
MNHPGYTLFATPIGSCALAWNDVGLTAVRLPESSDARLRSAMRHRFPALEPQSPPATVQQAIVAIRLLLDGGPDQLRSVRLDLSPVGPFYRQVYEAARRIPAGATLTYGELAARVGAPGAARAVGQAMGRNPWPLIVPCHRVLAAGGRTGGFSAPGGVATKLRLLRIEGAPLQVALAL